MRLADPVGEANTAILLPHEVFAIMCHKYPKDPATTISVVFCVIVIGLEVLLTHVRALVDPWVVDLA